MRGKRFSRRSRRIFSPLFPLFLFLVFLVAAWGLCNFAGALPPTVGQGGASTLTQSEADEAESAQEVQEELTENIESLIEDLDLEELQAYLDSLEEFSSWDVADKIMELIDGGTLDYESVFAALFSLLTDSLTDMLPAFGLILAIALLCGILNTVKTGFLQDSTAEIIFFVCYAAVLVVLLSQTVAVFTLCFNAMKDMRTQMEIIFPILLTLMAAGGGTVSATVYQPAVAFLSGGVSEILTGIVMPFTVVIVVLNMVERLNSNVKLKGFISLFKSANKWLIGLSVAVFGIFLSVQGLTSATYDGISLRAVKYAISNSVPIVGGFISGGFDLVLAGSTLIKNSVGMIGIFVLLSGVVQPLVTVAGFSLGLRLTAAVCEPIGDERISGFLTGLSESMGFLVACLLCMAFLYFLTVLLLICSAGVII